ncbi:MAG: DUF4340 domain-containing protein [Phycisphaerae bacterium]
MKAKTVILLVVVFVALLCAVLISQALRDDSPQTREKQLVFAGNPSGVQSVSLQPSRGTAISLTRTDDTWRLTQPVNAPARSLPVESLAEIFTDLEYVRMVKDNEGDPAVTGLNDPLWTLSLVDEKETVYRLEIGRAVALSGGEKFYVRRPDTQTDYVVAVDFRRKLEKSVSDFRDMTVMKFASGSVESITIDATDTVTLNRTADGWRMETDKLEVPADSDVVGEMLAPLSYLRTERFVADDAEPDQLGAYGLDQPRVKATIRLQPEPTATGPATQPGRSHTLLIGSGTGDEFYAMLDGDWSVFTIPADTVTPLQAKTDELRSRRLLPGDLDNATDVTIRTGDRTIAIKRDGLFWKMVTPFMGRAEDAAVENLLARLTMLRADSFPDASLGTAAFGMLKPAAVITAQSPEGDPVTLTIGGQSPSGELTFVTVEGSGSVAAVKSETIAPLLKGPKQYWDRTLLSLQANEEPVKLVLDRGDVQLTLARTPAGQWRLTKPVLDATETDAVQKLLDAIAFLRAEQIEHLGPNPPKKLTDALDQIKVTVHTEITESPATSPADTQPTTTTAPAKVTRNRHTLVLGQVGSAAYARQPGTEPIAIGRVDPEIPAAFQAELRDRQLWEFQPSKVTGLTLRRGEKKLSLTRDGEGWTYTADRFVKIDPAAVRQFLQTVAEMPVARFVAHNTGKLGKFGLDKPHTTLTLEIENDQTVTIELSKQTTDTGGRYVTLDGLRSAAALSAGDSDVFDKTYKDFQAE